MKILYHFIELHRIKNLSNIVKNVIDVVALDIFLNIIMYRKEYASNVWEKVLLLDEIPNAINLQSESSQITL